MESICKGERSALCDIDLYWVKKYDVQVSNFSVFALRIGAMPIVLRHLHIHGAGNVPWCIFVFVLPNHHTAQQVNRYLSYNMANEIKHNIIPTLNDDADCKTQSTQLVMEVICLTTSSPEKNTSSKISKHSSNTWTQQSEGWRIKSPNTSKK
jgi:hypothetical protein